jgi:hypothetical protein
MIIYFLALLLHRHLCPLELMVSIILRSALHFLEQDSNQMCFFLSDIRVLFWQ